MFGNATPVEVTGQTGPGSLLLKNGGSGKLIVGPVPIVGPVLDPRMEGTRGLHLPSF